LADIATVLLRRSDIDTLALSSGEKSTFMLFSPSTRFLLGAYLYSMGI